MAFRRMVLAVDGSPPSVRAVEVCAALAAALGAHVTVIHVSVDPLMIVPPVAPTEAMITPPLLTDEALREAEAAGEAVLARAAQTLRERGVTVATRQARGSVGVWSTRRSRSPRTSSSSAATGTAGWRNCSWAV